LARVNCVDKKNSVFCDSHGVRGFPTLKVFRNDGSDPSDYEDERKADGIVAFMKRAALPPVTELSSEEEVREFSKDDDVRVIAFLRATDDSLMVAFTDIAKKMRSSYSFGVVRDKAAVNSAFGVSSPSIIVLRSFDDPQVTLKLEDELNIEEVSAFIVGLSLPALGEIGPGNYEKYVKRQMPLVWIFVDPNSEEQKKFLEDTVRPVARDFSDKLSFVWLDGVQWKEHASNFGLSAEKTPCLSIQNMEEMNFVYDESKDITSDGLRAHVEGFLDGSLKSTVKSEPVPEDNSGPVTVVVGSTFRDIVYDETKDVLVEFYAPWCGHCKALAPEYEKLGEIFAEDEKIVIGKIDATANDFPASVRGYPSLKLYLAEDKENPIDYEGPRTAKGLALFVRDRGNPPPVDPEDLEGEGDESSEDSEGLETGVEDAEPEKEEEKKPDAKEDL